MQQLRKGYIFEGKYRIEGELGRGGFGMVYQAHQIGMERAVALKVLNPDMSAHAARTARERFMREVRIISKLRHPNTVTIHDFGETVEGMVYMVLEFVDGETLKDRLRRRGAMEELRAINVAIQIAKSLSEAHRHGIIHRDLKPANIMLTELGSDPDYVKVLDFGVARLRSADPAAELTSHGLPPGERELIGTPRYMSPEQVRGEELTGASDVYSLGLIIYEMLTGEAAVQGDTTMALITQQISPEPLRMLQLQAVHPHLQHLLRHATEKRLDARYRTVDILAQELELVADALKRPATNFRSSGHEEFLMGNHYEQGHDPMRQSWGQPQQAWGQPQQGFQSGHHNYPPPGQPMPTGSFGQPGGWAQPTGPHPTIPPMGSPTGGYGAIQGPRKATRSRATHRRATHIRATRRSRAGASRCRSSRTRCRTWARCRWVPSAPPARCSSRTARRTSSSRRSQSPSPTSPSPRSRASPPICLPARGPERVRR